MERLTKDYPVFDCDAHVTESPRIWSDYMTAQEREIVRPWFYPDAEGWIHVNGVRALPATWAKGRSSLQGFHQEERRMPNRAEIGGPGVNKKVLRKLFTMKLTEEQVEYTEHKGARDPKARLVDMDIQGIDQVVVIPLMMFGAYLFVEHAQASAIVARAYNDWVHDWCSTAPDRLFPAAVLPSADPVMAARELRRVAAKGFKVAMLRPVDAGGRYPNHPRFAPLWKAFEETQVVVAMHSLPRALIPSLNPSMTQLSAGDFLFRSLSRHQLREPCEPLGFIYEAMVWLPQVLLSGFFEDYPGVTRMAIMESNATWVPLLLEQCDKAFHLYRNERKRRATRLPSELYFERCFSSFESDETLVYRQHKYFESVGIWASDAYHHDGSDAWEAIREMREAGVPLDVEQKFMGANARRMYRIEPKMYTKSQPAPIERPAWYPKAEEIKREFAELTARR
ncbi:MAG: amidohydrolase family protein [Chloroflexi bacterium]|nr:amidohydrolase family protein [Chloroflexota bacterium]